MKCTIYFSVLLLILSQGLPNEALAQCESCKSYTGYLLKNEWGVSGTEAGELNSPRGIAIDNSGFLYVAERNAQRLQKFNAEDGTFIRVFGEKPDPSVFTHMTTAIDNDANVYMTHDSGTFVYKFDSTGTYLTRWNGQGILFGYYTAFNPNDNLLYVSDYFTEKIYKYQTDGTFEGTIGEAGSGNGQFQDPSGIGFDSYGNIYVADEDNHRIQKLDSDGNFLMTWGSFGSADGQFINPNGLVVDCANNVHVIDGTGRLQMFDSNGNFIASQASSGQYLTVNPITGDIYVSNLGSNSIKIYEVTFEDFLALDIDPSNANTTISASITSIEANGRDTTIINVQLADTSGEHLTENGGTVVLNTTLGTLSSVTNNQDGTYTAILTAGTTPGKAEISATINCEAISDVLQVSFLQPEFFPDDASVSAFIGLWLDASDQSTLFQDEAGTNPVTSEGQSIRLWKDKSSNANDAVLYAGQSPGTYYSSEKEGINNEPVVRFDVQGSSDVLGTVFETGFDARTGTNEDITIFTVYRPESRVSNSGQGHAVWGNDNGDFDRFFYSYWRGTEFGGDGVNDGVISLGGSSGGLNIADAGNLNQVYNLTAVYDGNGTANSSSIAFDGEVIQLFTDNSDPTAALPNLYLGWDGDNATFDGDIAEMIVYNRVLSECEIASINFYLGNKYGKDFSNLKARFDYSTDFPDDINGLGILVNNCTNARRDYVEIGLASIDNPSSNDTFNEFLTFGHNNAGKGSSTQTPDGVGARLLQVWRVDEDGDLGTVDVTFDVSDFGVPQTATAIDFALLIDADGDFSDAAIENADISYNAASGKVQIVGYDFNDGDFFTLGIVAPLEVSVAIEDQVVEGNTITYTVSTNEPVSGDLTVAFSVSNISTNASDFMGTTTGTVTIPDGATSVQSTIQTNGDGIEEAFESFSIDINEITNGLAVIDIAKDTALIVASPRSPVLAAASSVLDKSFNISWDNPLATDYYTIDVSTQSDFSSFVIGYEALQVNGTDSLISGLIPNTQYFIRVNAVNTIGTSTYSNTVFVTTFPEAPVALSATNITTSSFVANWSTVTNATSYELDVASDSLFTEFVLGFQNVSTTNTQFTVDDQLLTGGTYYYRVRAESVAGTSLNSNIIEVLTIPDAPLSLSESQVENTSFQLSWSASVGATNYLIDVSLDENFSSLVTGLEAKSVTGTSTLIEDLEGGEDYYIRLRASNVSGNSVYSSTLRVVTIPNVPTSLNASNFIANGLTISWQAITSAEYYELDISENEDFSTFFGTYESKRIDGTSEDITSLNGGSTYYFRVRAVRETRTSANAGSLEVLTLANAPFVLSLANATNSGFEITWGSSIGAESYLVEVSTDSTFTIPSVTGFDPLSTTALSAEVTGLGPATTYYVRLRAENISGVSGFLETLNMATKPMVPVNILAESVSSRQLQLSWNATEGAMEYLVDVSTTSNFSQVEEEYLDISTTDTTLLVDGLSPEVTYFFRVQASNIIVNTVSEESEVSEITMPFAPIVDSVVATTTSFTVYLESNAEVINYFYQVSEDEFTSLLPGTTTFTTTLATFTIEDLSDNKPYYYKIWAETNNGFTDTTNVITQFTLAPLPELAFIDRPLFTLTTRIEWGYYTEINAPSRLSNVEFQIERSDNEGQTFQRISDLIPMGNDGGMQFEDFTDQEELNASYRIRVINEGGYHYYNFQGNIVTAIESNVGKDWVNVYPSLLKNTLYIHSKKNIIKNYQWEIYDLTGKKVLTGNENQPTIDVSCFPKGNYHIVIISDAYLKSFKLVKP